MVTHDPRIAAYADRIVFLKDGKIVNETDLGDDGDGTGEPAGREPSQVRALAR
jgi:putative ABC transport system ATP-binding protein